MKPLNRQTAPAPALGPVKVLQIGEGNFLRGFVNWIIDILNEKTDFNGSVEVIQPRDRHRDTIRLLNQQDGLFHVLLQGIRGGKTTQEKRLISCISGAINPYDNYADYLKLGENPELKFVFSNTTEAGIFFDETDESVEKIANSFPGKLTALLYHRYQHYSGGHEKGLIIIPCELIEKNGEKLRDIVLRYARHWKLPEDFIQWVKEHNIFCNTLVDRIVPGFPKDNIKEIQQELGYEDKLVVKAEPFHLLVIEAPESVRASFPTDKAGLEVKFVKDLSPYRTRKVRILNGAHTALVPVAYLHGMRTVREAVEDEQTGTFLRKAIFEEIIPTLDMPAEELEAFADAVIERFRNPFIHHELISIALNSVSKYKVRVLPSVLEYHKRKGKLPERLLHSLSALIMFYRGEWREESIPLNDTAEVLGFFEKAWQQENTTAVVETILSNENLWGTDLTKIDGFLQLVSEGVTELQQLEEQPI